MSTPTSRLGRVIAWCAGLLLLHLALTSAYVSVVGPRHKAARSDQLWFEAPQQLDLVFLGDSHPRSAINPKIMGPTWVNLATGGEHYTKSYYRFRTLYELQPRQVRAVVIPLDPNGFTSWHADQFAPEFVWGKYIDFWELGGLREDRWTFMGKWAKARLVPYAGELRTFNQLRSKRFGFGEALASGRFDGLRPARRDHQAREQARAHFEGFDPMDPNQRLGFDLLVEWAEENSIPVVAVSYPLTREYLRVIRDELGDPVSIVQSSVVDDLPRTHPGVLHLDYRESYVDNPEMFADPHHLNQRGRAVFTRKLAEDLEHAGIL